LTVCSGPAGVGADAAAGALWVGDDVVPEEVELAVAVSLELIESEDPEAAQPHRTPTATAIITHLITPDRIETRISLPLLDSRSSCAQISASW
jgi:hypothetical protein